MSYPTETLKKFGQAYTLPTYVKQAMTSDFDEIAVPTTKATVWLRKFADLTGEYSIKNNPRLEKRAEILSISDDLLKLERDYADFTTEKTEKTAAPTETYPIRNKDEFTAAVRWLKKNAYVLPLDERREFAGRILEKSAEYEAEIDEQIIKFAGQGIGSVYKIIPNLEKRAALIRNSRVTKADVREKTACDLEHLAKQVKTYPADVVVSENLDKIAAVLQFVDNEYGLSGHYNNGYLDDPDSVIFAQATKTAEEIEKYACQLGNDLYDIRDFEQIKLADIIDTFGSGFGSSMSDGLFVSHEKIAETLEVMTELETALFKDLVKAAGIQPKYTVIPTVNLKELTATASRLQKHADAASALGVAAGLTGLGAGTGALGGWLATPRQKEDEEIKAYQKRRNRNILTGTLAGGGLGGLLGLGAAKGMHKREQAALQQYMDEAASKAQLTSGNNTYRDGFSPWQSLDGQKIPPHIQAELDALFLQRKAEKAEQQAAAATTKPQTQKEPMFPNPEYEKLSPEQKEFHQRWQRANDTVREADRQFKEQSGR